MTTRGERKRGAKGTPRAAGIQQYTALQMRPFVFNQLDHALTVAEAAAPEHFCDESIAALILLVAGVAAMEDAEDRQTTAYFIIERLFSRTQKSLDAMKTFVREREAKGAL